ncbi:hypothetical protein AGMMS49960_20210 [Betaproteobacteria bacterium]|nr:hypothetical protein AGMMS49543_16420 [Betaproteobacteria bacterium]GHU04479.1 hypothetical protein AGMMS49960_20210 [Betaproteobacteria bacterium]GHU24233.1 hypothetical protein AGMMS50243_27040 [Betaproteobacteria bacterium]
MASNGPPEPRRSDLDGPDQARLTAEWEKLNEARASLVQWFAAERDRLAAEREALRRETAQERREIAREQAVLAKYLPAGAVYRLAELRLDLQRYSGALNVVREQLASLRRRAMELGDMQAVAIQRVDTVLRETLDSDGEAYYMDDEDADAGANDAFDELLAQIDDGYDTADTDD